MNQVWLAFITGLTTGGISCFAVQGGLLASSLAQQKEGNKKISIATFLISKLVSYSLLGALLGLVGSSLFISPKLQGIMQIVAGLFMLTTVGKLLNLHPFFRHFAISPPKTAFRLLRTTSLNENIFAPAVLGFLTILIPCGITQSMMFLSIASGNPLWGALILAAFILGTSPVFFALGVASGELLKRNGLKYVAATAIFVLGIISINTGQILRGSVHTLQNYWLAAIDKVSSGQPGGLAGINAQGFQEAEIQVLSSGYRSNVKTLKAGVPVKLSLVTAKTSGCSRAFTIPEYGITKILPETGNVTLEFTPSKTGRLTYTCNMGMYTGYFEVI